MMYIITYDINRVRHFAKNKLNWIYPIKKNHKLLCFGKQKMQIISKKKILFMVLNENKMFLPLQEGGLLLDRCLECCGHHFQTLLVINRLWNNSRVMDWQRVLTVPPWWMEITMPQQWFTSCPLDLQVQIREKQNVYRQIQHLSGNQSAGWNHYPSRSLDSTIKYH